jgi:hypothetical protein
MSKKINFKDIPCYSNNPFLDGLNQRLEARKGYKKQKREGADTETGEVFGYSVTVGEAFYDWKDPIPFVKVFNDQDNFKDMSQLSKGANCLFWLISSKLKPNADVIRLSLAEYMDFACTTNRGQYYLAVIELIDKFFMVKIGADSFYINPVRFFNGKREVLAGDPHEAYIKRNK